MNKFDLRSAWDQVAATYQARNPVGTADIHYGPWASSERTLQLLGPVRGLRVLELGCGGGQASIAFAKQGATVTGIDISTAQIEFARRLASQAQEEVRFVVSAAEDLAGFGEGQWDLVFSTYTLHYIEDLPRCLAECHHVLCDTGRLVFSLDHPLRDCFFDQTENELTLYPARSYYDQTLLRWRFPETAVVMQSHHYTIAQWIDLLTTAGFQLTRLAEPMLPDSIANEQWPEDDPMFSIRNLPQTVIFIAKKSTPLYP